MTKEDVDLERVALLLINQYVIKQDLIDKNTAQEIECEINALSI